MRLRTRTAAAVLALLCSTGAAVALPRAAQADPLAGARARAAQLAAQVDALQTQAEVATEHYDAAESQLGQVVTAAALAQRALDQAQAGQGARREQLRARVRALYMSGGSLGLLATVLASPTLTDLVERTEAVQAVVSADGHGVADAGGAVARAAALAQRLSRLAATRTRLQQQAAAAAGKVVSLLAQVQQLQAGADATVQALLAQQQAAAERAAAAEFAARVAAATGTLGIDPVLAGSTIAPDPVAAAAITAARTRLGEPYVWGASGPGSFDCSGLTQWAYAQAGVALPRVAADQWNAGPHPALDALAPGDLLFWATDVTDPTTIHHVALYIGGGYMIAAPHTGDVVRVQPVYLDGYIGAVRPTAAPGVMATNRAGFPAPVDSQTSRYVS